MNGWHSSIRLYAIYDAKKLGERVQAVHLFQVCCWRCDLLEESRKTDEFEKTHVLRKQWPTVCQISVFCIKIPNFLKLIKLLNSSNWRRLLLLTENVNKLSRNFSPLEVRDSFDILKFCLKIRKIHWNLSQKKVSPNSYFGHKLEIWHSVNGNTYVVKFSRCCQGRRSAY